MLEQRQAKPGSTFRPVGRLGKTGPKRRVWAHVLVLAHHEGTDILEGWSFHVAPASFVNNHWSDRITPSTPGLPAAVAAAELPAAVRPAASR
jgi:hypothetical protein